MSDRPHQKLRTLPANVALDGVYAIVNPQVGSTRQGKSYLKGLLKDASGEVPIRQWSFDESRIGQVAATGFVWVTGRTEDYNGSIQILVDTIQSVEVEASDLQHLLPVTSRDIDGMFNRVKSILGTLEHPGMRALADAYLGDAPLMDEFRTAPAAMNVHHAFIGGLLEHTLNLLEGAERLLPLYPQVNRDLVLMGLFLHDMGKTQELTWARGFDYTEDGNLIGHIVRGAINLQVKAAVAAKAGPRLSPSAVRCLQHIILSHHERLEFGAAKQPATPEAMFVALLDNLDAKMGIVLAAVERDRMGPGAPAFTEKVWALGTKLYRPDPLQSEP
ncbi:MAG: HD domain-containing protein [Planctomycetota bacterium]|nr:HD domain-containing protein [Planctomycetota bacterium]MDA1105241.1 HD domain-containing protein [Planctomycetota bacterium]